MADHTVGDGVVSNSGTLQANSGDSELDEKIAEWLHLDKVTYIFPNVEYAYLMRYTDNISCTVVHMLPTRVPSIRPLQFQTVILSFLSRSLEI